MPYNIGIIGAARRHQGTGPFIARTFARLGHDIAGVVGTSTSSSKQACQDLAVNYNIATQPYTDLKHLLSEQRLDIVVISSPPSTHLSYLEQALSNGCHVFCEKPLWWPANYTNDLSEAEYLDKIEHIITLARTNRCNIHINTQWPYTLKDFIRLHPNALINNKINQFTMHLSPQSEGISMLIDAASHGLSMLYQLVGRGNIDNLRTRKEKSSVAMDFDYQHLDGCIKTTLDFIQSNETPKPASYQINGFSVKRMVTLPEYQIQLQSDQQTVPIQDPLDASIMDFLAALDAQLETDELTLRQGASHLYQLINHFIKS